MRVVIDIETNSLTKPTKIWCIVCKDIDTKQLHIFRNLTTDVSEAERFRKHSASYTQLIGHNFLGYDYPILHNLLGWNDPAVSHKTIDTLIISKLVDYSRKGHSIEAYGEEFGTPKGDNKDVGFFKQWSQELEDYCVQDAHICNQIYDRYRNIITDHNWRSAINTEHEFQLICNDLHDNGFGFNTEKATKLLDKVTKDVAKLDEVILNAFPPRVVLIREFIPKPTKFGTISKTSVPKALHQNIHLYEVGTTYQHTHLVPFNPSSHKQLIQVLNEAGWKPENKTKTHIDTERDLHRLKYDREKDNSLDIELLSAKLKTLKVSGYKIDELNLSTLPATAPAPARSLAKRILLESRRRTLTEWLGLVESDGRIRGRFFGIGAWTHRMAHQEPNTANIPREFKEDGSVKLLGKELRELWAAPKNRLLVGVDAEGIQLRIFAHYIDDAEFTKSLVEGKKDDKSDPHSLNQRILGDVCKTRQAAKRFIYALLLGGGMDKLAAILECSKDAAKESLDRLLTRYSGFSDFKRTVLARDGKQGWFRGLDGRRVPIPGSTQRDRQHLAMSGYLQNGESIIIKKTAIITDRALQQEKLDKKWSFVNIVHDELQSEVKNDMDLALHVAKTVADAIKQAGEELNLKCPLAGSYWNDDHKDYTIGTNWYKTH